MLFFELSTVSSFSPTSLLSQISSMAPAIHSFAPPEESDASTAPKLKTPLSPTSHNLPSLKPVLKPSTSAARKSEDSARVRFEGVLSPNEWEGKEEEDVSMVEVTSDDDSVRLAGSQEVAKEEEAEEETEEGLAPLHSKLASLADARSLSGELTPAHAVEVRLLPSSTVRFDLIRRMMHTHLNDEYETLLTHSEINDWREVAALAQNVDRVWVAECCASFSLLPCPPSNCTASFCPLARCYPPLCPPLFLTS